MATNFFFKNRLNGCPALIIKVILTFVFAVWLSQHYWDTCINSLQISRITWRVCAWHLCLCLTLYALTCLTLKDYILIFCVCFISTIILVFLYFLCLWGFVIKRIAHFPNRLESLVNMLRNPESNGMPIDRTSGGPTSMMQSGISQAREFDDPPGLHEKTEYLLREWVNMYHSPAAGRDSTKAFTCFVQQVRQPFLYVG